MPTEINNFGLIGATIILAVALFFRGYLGKKGENVATREDMREITKQIEEVKGQFASLLEGQRFRNQMRLAAIDRRLATHQEAYALWFDLMDQVHQETIGQHVLKCQEWWKENCLFLTPEARVAFRTAYHAANSHSALLVTPSKESAKAASDNFALIKAAGPVLVEGASLPSLGEEEEPLTSEN